MLNSLAASLEATETDLRAAIDIMRERDEKLEAAKQQHRELTSALGLGDGVTEPQATVSEIIDFWQGIDSEARDHQECAARCEMCGDPLAKDVCSHCNGSGCGPGTATGAYAECEWCAGVGKVHTGCVEHSYAELAAQLEAVAALHYPADNTPGREPICPECEGRAGVHPCGCWTPDDRQPVCGHCNGYRDTSIPWPCPTARALGVA